MKKGDIIQLMSNPIMGLELTEKYKYEPAEIVLVLNSDAVLVKFDDGFMITVEVEMIREL